MLTDKKTRDPLGWKAANIYGHMNYIIGRYEPFSLVEDERYREITDGKLEPMSTKTFIKMMHEIVDDVVDVSLI